MPAAQIQTATQAEADRCVFLIALVFGGDPAARWLYPDPERYLEYFPRFVRAFGGNAFEHGAAHYIDRAAAALWFPPNVEPDEASLMALFEASVPPSEQATLFAVLEEMGSYHPKEPHWYLSLIGTDPAQQGKGHGSALLRRALAICDAEKTPAYLEATSARNVPLYQRHGFEALGTIQIGAAPPDHPDAADPALRVLRFSLLVEKNWLPGPDSNQRPSG